MDNKRRLIISAAEIVIGAALLVGGVLTIVFLLLGKQELSTITGFAVSLLVLLYWLSFFVLKNKY